MSGELTDVAPPARAPTPHRFPLLRLYALAVASFGLYLLVWIRRTAKAQGAGADLTHTPTWWALGSVCPPICALVLYALALRAREEGRATGVLLGITPSIPALIYAAVALAAIATPLSALLAPFLLVGPIPFLLIQRELNCNASAVAEREAPAQRVAPGWREIVTLSLGLPAVIAAIWFVDLPALSRLLQQPFEVDQRISGTTADYQLSIPGPGWRRVAPGTLGNPDTDLELTGPEADTWLVVYVTQGGATTVDEMVEIRRKLVFDSAEVRGYEDRRRFLDGDVPVVSSLATYLIGSSLSDQGIFVVMTTVAPTRSVEVIGFSQNVSAMETDLRKLVESFALTRSPSS